MEPRVTGGSSVKWRLGGRSKIKTALNREAANNTGCILSLRRTVSCHLSRHGFSVQTPDAQQAVHHVKPTQETQFCPWYGCDTLSPCKGLKISRNSKS